MSDIFISYNHEDRLRAEMFAQALEGRGWSIFWDRTIPTGKTWRETIGRELSEARCVIVLWSNTSVESEWVREEADDDRQRRVLVPARIDDIQPPMGFRGIQTADLVNWNASETTPAFDRLIADIGALIEAPSSGPKEQIRQPEANVFSAPSQNTPSGRPEKAAIVGMPENQPKPSGWWFAFWSFVFITSVMIFSIWYNWGSAP